MKLETILTTKGPQVLTIRGGQTLREAVAALAEHNVGALIVLEEAGQPCGIISERDVVRALARGGDVLAQPVSAVMTKAVIAGTPQDDVEAVLKTMTAKRFRHLPVLEHGQLVGLISIGDLVKAQVDQYRGEIETLETQIIGG
jgi:CBS domain-containing protein